MFRSTSPFTVVASCLVVINLLSLTSPGQCKSILQDPDSPLPPVPEKQAISFKLEQALQNGTGIPCTTEDPDIPSGIGINNGIIGSRYRWKAFNVYPDPAYNSQERTLINNAMYRLSQALPCLRFGIYPPGARPSGDYVHIRMGSGCSAQVGKVGGAQRMTLHSPGCMSVGIIIHEMIHALGFYHEHSRSDRDDHVNILWQNIESASLPGKEHNFNKYSSSVVATYGVRYNTRSIMHYGARDFTRNGQPTITAKNGEVVGMTGNLEQTDIDKLRRMYNC